MSDDLYQLDTAKWPRYELPMPKCDRCGEKHYPLLYGVCDACIYKLIQADKSTIVPDRTREDG